MWALKEQKRSRRIDKVFVGSSDLLLPHYQINGTVCRTHPDWKKGHEVGSIDVYIHDKEGLFSFNQVANLIHLVRTICLKYYVSHSNVFVLEDMKGFNKRELRGLLRRE